MPANSFPQLLGLLRGACLVGEGGQIVGSRRGGREQETVTQWGGSGTAGEGAKIDPDAH